MEVLQWTLTVMGGLVGCVCVVGKPDAFKIHKGIVTSAWEPFAGQIPLILKSTIACPDDTAYQQVASPEDTNYLGADAIAVVTYVCGPQRRITY